MNVMTRTKRVLKRRPRPDPPEPGPGQPSLDCLRAALEYTGLGWSVVPVPPGSKVPYIKWKPYQTRRAETHEITAWFVKWPDANIAVITGEISNLCVIDFDGPGALEAFENKICQLPQTIIQNTGRPEGGCHYLFHYPGGGIRNSSGEICENVDIRGQGGLVVVAPSVHKSGRHYEWTNVDPGLMGLDDLLDLPGEVIEWVQKHKRRRCESRPGGKDPGEPEKGLTLKPVPHGRRDVQLTRLCGRWLGKGLDRAEVEKLALAWNADLEEPMENDQVLKVVNSIAAADTGASQDAIRQAIAEMNQDHFVTRLGGRCVVVTEVRDPVTGYPDIVFSSPSDFHNLFANWKIPNPKRGEPGQPKNLKVSRLWFESVERRECEGIVFEPGKEIEGYYNLWRGFSVEPVQGDWSLFKEHIRTVICNGNADYTDWLIAWMARIIQKPNKPSGASIVLRGDQGTGKGVFTHTFGHLFGPHYLHLAHQRALTSRFNQHLKDKLLVFCDEGVWAGDRAGEGVLKSLITEPYIHVEPKGKDAFSVRNHVNLIIASNQNWVVPAGLVDRRFFCLDVSDNHIQDQRYFKAILDQMKNGGLAAMLFDLLEYDISQVDLGHIPRTVALLDQIERTMTPLEKFWLEVLMEGSNGVADSWSDCVTSQTLYNNYLDYCKDILGVRYRLAKNVFVRETCSKILPCSEPALRRMGTEPRRVVIFPSLKTCREVFSDYVGQDIEW